MDKNKIVENLNNIITESIRHGADGGGSYNSNGEDLVSAVENAMKFFQLDEYEINYDYNEDYDDEYYSNYKAGLIENDYIGWIKIVKKKEN